MPRAAVTAVLGPTNTGKTHLAVERFCAHASGMMGFPLRLLAREIYDRVVAIKGPKEVGLLTGEEKILPDNARWLLCTTESMPADRDVAFVALDEAQLGADPERGHVFTDRLLRARGREETMILGSESLRPIIRALVPEAEIIGRPRFSSLTYAGAKKLSRLPPRSAIIAFSAEEVYAIAELIRRTRGGAAVVMGALSPRTRNAQVAMYQAGEVDYLVATDAIGMGLNMDVGHIAFASLSKFDGRRQRRLTLSEMAQIAGRAGRHQRDGTFGTLTGRDVFTDIEIERIEEHRFPALDHVFWRNSEPVFDSLASLIESLEQMPDLDRLRAAPEAADLAVLRQLASEPAVIAQTRNRESVARLWDACGLPDFRKAGTEHHARLVARIFDWRTSGQGHIPPHAIADALVRLDNVQGDIATLADRIAGTRTWAYAAHRRDWLADPAHWAARAAAVEERLSDALHARLTERFVDRRTTALIRDIGADPELLDVELADDGIVNVEGEPIGRLDGFRFTPDPTARLGERKRLLAAAERRLPRELARRAARLATAPDTAFGLHTVHGEMISLVWEGHQVAQFVRGSAWFAPRVVADAALLALPATTHGPAIARLEAWLVTQIAARLAPVFAANAERERPDSAAELRAVLSQCVERGGILPRVEVQAAFGALDGKARQVLRATGFEAGLLDIFAPALLKPEATRWRMALLAVYRGEAMPPLPMPGLGLLDRPAPALGAAANIAGYRGFGTQMLRVDLVERLARAILKQSLSAEKTREGFTPDRNLATSLGIGEATLARLLRALGYVTVGEADALRWRWRGRPRTQTDRRPDNPAFAALQALKRKPHR